MANLDRGKTLDNDGYAQEASTSLPQPIVWFCPSRWLLAYYDLQANIQTMSSHMCLADLNNDGDNLMALVDFKERNQAQTSSQVTTDPAGNPLMVTPKQSPYECRMRVYRGQQLIYNHFLDDIPSSLVTTSISLPAVTSAKGTLSAESKQSLSETSAERQQQPLLTLTVNDQIYLYHKLRPSHRLSLEDDECILDSLNKSEIDAWEMVRQNKVDLEAMRELLFSLSQELGSHSLTSHSNNFLALDSDEARKQYLLSWRLKRFSQNQSTQPQGGGLSGELIMSMDTICCSAARLKYTSKITRSGDFGSTREKGNFLNNARWNRIVDIQKEGLLLGTEDRHLLVFELRSIRTRLECHYRLPAVPDHILVERKSPSSFDIKQDLRTLTYKILVSCRNCRIYSIDQLYLVGNKASPCELKELVALKSNVLDMCWTGMDEWPPPSGVLHNRPRAAHGPTFVVACLDRRVYCFSSRSGQCKWIIELELPITCLICLPKIQIGPDEASLVGVGLQANRVDFYVATSGLIVDSIYFSRDDCPQAMTFGRFGREDNCLCLVTSLGHLLVFILKRMAKFEHGQCLSSAASYASSTLANCSQILRQSATETQANGAGGEPQGKQLELAETSSSLPNAFSLSKTNSANVTDKMLELMLHSEHRCDQVAAKSALDSYASRPRLQIPIKGREFVDQILEQSQKSRQTGLMFASQMVTLRDKVKQTILQQSNSLASEEVGNRVMLAQVIGLGTIYRVRLALRLHMEQFLERHKRLLENEADGQWQLTCLLRSRLQGGAQIGESGVWRHYQVRPFRFELDGLEKDERAKFGLRSVYETTIEFKMSLAGQTPGPVEGDSVPVEVQILARLSALKPKCTTTIIQRPLLVTSVNVPLVC